MSDTKREKFNRLEEIFAAVVSSGAGRRAELLAEACGDDDQLRQQVQELLDASDQAESFLEPSAREATSDSDSFPANSANIPKRIGPYSIQRVIATGGMGTIYQALQEQPRRTVAVKVMRRGIASRSALRRFEYESQLLARLRHPGIAHVYQAGTYDDGGEAVPYFAMEYIPNAKPITDHAEQKQLRTRERLELFAQVCDAIHHGHQKGIIHRDLKPTNILVDAQGQVKIIDFGVAGSTDSDMALTTLQTDVGQLIGTLQYMSPEQCEADPHDLDVRSDVYALGVVLYELLCGKTPYDIKQLPMHEATRVVREQQPARLSTINARLRGDVETIVHNALEKDRDRRYRSTAELADDIRRYLAGKAIHASPPSIVYQLRVFARRHKGLFGAAAAIFAVLLLGTIVSTTMYLRAEEARKAVTVERDRARAAEEQATSVANFLTDMLKSIAPQEVGETVSLKSILDKASEIIRNGALSGEPLVEASVRMTLGDAFAKIDQLSEGEKHLRMALKLRREVLGPEDPSTLDAAHALIHAFMGSGRKTDELLQLARETFEIRKRVFGLEHEATLSSMRQIAALLARSNQLDEAEIVQRELLASYQRTRGREDLETLWVAHDLCVTLRIRGKYSECESLLRHIAEVRQRVLGEQHVHTIHAMRTLAFTLCDQRWVLDGEKKQLKLREAEQVARRVIEIGREARGDDWDLSLAMVTVAVSLRELDEYAESEKWFRDLFDLETREEPGPGHLTTRIDYARLKMAMGELSEAERILRDVLRPLQGIVGAENDATGGVMIDLGDCLTRMTQYRKAEQHLREGHRILEMNYRKGHPKIHWAIRALVDLYDAWGKPDEAAKWRVRLTEQPTSESPND